MCGIAGIFDLTGHAHPERGAILQRMTRTLYHRGPDDEGFHVRGPIALGFRRLSIIDLSGGHQPLANEDETVWVVFNGEIYNYADLTRTLEGKGHVFKTHSDTECIVHAWEEWGTACVERFRGMFAFAVWDHRQQQLFLGRDRVGKKPLYYARVGDAFIFGSEIKALLEYPGLDRALDCEALSDYVSLLYVPSPKSIFRSVRKLAPGHTLLVDANGARERRYWNLSFQPGNIPKDPVEGLREHLHDAVAIRLRSDVPLGAFLSGGLDSSAIVAFMAAAATDHSLITSSIGFSEDAFNEVAYARQVAQHFHTQHHEDEVSPRALEVLDTLSWHYDEPFADSSAVPTYYVSKLARQHVTVALSGDGGDETFAGYRRYYFDVRENRVRELVPAALRNPLFGLLGALYPKADYLPQIFRGKAFLSNVARTPWGAYFFSVSGVHDADKALLLSGDARATLNGYDTAQLFADLYHAADGPDSLSRIQYIDFNTYLPEDILTKVDRASMATSLEVRCPLLDHHLIEYVAALPSSLKLKGSQTKLLLRDLMRPMLPEAILNRGKMGFAVPVGKWLRTDLRPLVDEYVLGSGTRHDLFDSRFVQKLWREHLSGVRERTPELWGILMFNLWYDRFVRQPMARTEERPARSPGRY